VQVNIDYRNDAMKHIAHPGHAHEHHNHEERQLDMAMENVLILLIVAASLFIPFAFVVHFF
jgi:hypothetical protein